MKHLQRVLLLLICITISSQSYYSAPVNAKPEDSTAKLNEVLKLIQGFHLSGASEAELADAAIQGMIDYLGDPYTEYYSKKEESQLLELLGGHTLSIGIRIDIENDQLYISDVRVGSPAEQSGLIKGDFLKEINGKQVTVDNIGELLKAASGKKEGDTITLVIHRKSESKQFIIPFKNMEIPNVTSQWFPESQTGYISLALFTVDTDKAFTTSLQGLEKKGMKSLLLDLRNNGGGYMEAAKQIASHFIKEGVFYHTINRDGEKRSVSLSKGTQVTYPIFILVNEYSASASEVFAGAMQDYKLAQIIGEQTYGKGVIQLILPVLNGGTLKVTTQEYLTPNLHEVHEVGIKPDIEVRGSTEQLVRVLQLSGEKSISLSMSKAELTLNNVSFPRLEPDSKSTSFILEKDHYFIASRLLMAVIGGEAIWDNNTSSVVLSKKDIKLTLSSSSKDMIIRNGVSYVKAAVFAKKFRELSWYIKDGTISLKASH